MGGPPFTASSRMERRRVHDLEVGAVIRPSECRSSFDHFGLGAPLTYQFEPLSARIIPYVFSAWSTMRACFGKPEMSTLAFSRTRRPIGGSDGSSDDDA